MFQAILNLQDSAHSIALGTAIGLFVAWTPTVGIHMLLVVGLTLLFRANKVAGLIAVYVSNPLTIVPMYWFAYWLGAIFLEQELTYEELRTILSYQGWDGFKTAFWRICVELAGPMWLGGLVLALAHAIPGYYATRWAVQRFRRKNPANVRRTDIGTLVQSESVTTQSSTNDGP
jgi:hypothetical protein